MEDNYPTGEGDCISLKYILDKDDENSNFARKYIKTYCEFPPIIKTQKTRWLNKWITENYPTMDPIYSSLIKMINENEDYSIFFEEANSYNWLCYIEIYNKDEKKIN